MPRAYDSPVLQLALPLVLALCLPNTAAAVGPDPNTVYVESLAYAGTGCPPDTVDQSFSDDRQSVTLNFKQFSVSVAPLIPASERIKDCALTLGLHLPPGWQTWIAFTDAQGSVQLPAGLSASVTTTYSMDPPSRDESSNGDSGVSRTESMAMGGPVSSAYVAHAEPTLTALAPDTCNEVQGRVQPLTITTRIGLDNTGNPDGKGKLTVDSLDGKARTTLQVDAKVCN